MINVIKCIMVFILELNIYFCIGHAITKFKYTAITNSFIMKGIFGFLGYHVFFWAISFPCMLLNVSLNLLTTLWILFIGLFLIMILKFQIGKIICMYKQVIILIWGKRAFFFPCIIMGILLICYVCLNGKIDADARTYIGEVTTMVDTKKLAGIFVKTGMEVSMISLKRSFAMFGANSAVLCNFFQIHPLVFCRTVRAAINVVYFSFTVFQIFKWIFRNQKNIIEQALMCTMLVQGILFAFTNTIYTEARFLLYRAYEGKAYCATTLILITVLISIKFCDTMDKRLFVILFLDMLAGMSISASATFILPIASGCIIFSYIICKRKWIYTIAFIFSIFPNIVYILLSITGFSGFSLEG